MSATTLHSMLIILVAVLITVIIRFSPFILFGRGGNPPKYIVYLGDVLPPALMSILIIYCIRNIELFSGSHGFPEIISIIVAMALHVWKNNVLISIAVSTVLYMVLIQVVFA